VCIKSKKDENKCGCASANEREIGRRERNNQNGKKEVVSRQKKEKGGKQHRCDLSERRKWSDMRRLSNPRENSVQEGQGRGTIHKGQLKKDQKT